MTATAGLLRASDMVPIEHETSDRIVRTIVFAVPTATLAGAGWLAWGAPRILQDLLVLAITYKSAPKHRPISDEPAKREPVAQTRLPDGAHKAISVPHGHGPTTLFQVAFASAMSDPDIAVLARTLDLTMHMYPKLRPSPKGPGAVRLDHHSGLFLKHGRSEGQWVLEARTWGHPAPESIHEWQVLAAGAARLLDPVVAFPERLPAVSCEHPLHPVGRAANKRLARIGRRLQRL